MIIRNENSEKAHESFPILATQGIGLPGRAPIMIAKTGITGHTGAAGSLYSKFPMV
jgi:hypothetical protein